MRSIIYLKKQTLGRWVYKDLQKSINVFLLESALNAEIKKSKVWEENQ